MGTVGAPKGPVGRAASMAAPPGVPPMRVLEEALGIGLSPTGDAAEAVAAEGAYYLERILLVLSGPAPCPWDTLEESLSPQCVVAPTEVTLGV